MAILNWGPLTKFEYAPSVNGEVASGATWTEIDMPKNGSINLTPQAGDEVEAKDEADNVIDSRTGKTTYKLEWENFVKKGTSAPFTDDDGIISGEFALRITPGDTSCKGILIERCTLSVQETYTTADGQLLKYTAKCLKPATGKTIKPYTANTLTLDKYALYFGSAADSTGKTVTATSTGNVTATSSESWCTVTTSGKVTTVKVTANSGSEPRSAIVSITADGLTSAVNVMQIP